MSFQVFGLPVSRGVAIGRAVLVKALSELLQLRDVNLFDIGDVWNAALGFLHPFANLAAQAEDARFVGALPDRITLVRGRKCAAGDAVREGRDAARRGDGTSIAKAYLARAK